MIVGGFEGGGEEGRLPWRMFEGAEADACVWGGLRVVEELVEVGMVLLGGDEVLEAGIGAGVVE